MPPTTTRYALCENMFGQWAIYDLTGAGVAPRAFFNRQSDAWDALRVAEGLPPADTSLATRVRVEPFGGDCTHCKRIGTIGVVWRGATVYLICTGCQDEVFVR